MKKQTPVVIVDMHAEATSEKQAIAAHLDGLASAVLGTHTHVQTADDRSSPGHGLHLRRGDDRPVRFDDRDGQAGGVQRFLYSAPGRLPPARHGARLCAVLLDIDETTGMARSIQPALS